MQIYGIVRKPVRRKVRKKCLAIDYLAIANHNMRNLLILFIAIFVSACHHRDAAREKQLQDTLEYLKKKTDYKPLAQADAYGFINQYYLPKLDARPIGRKVFVHPLKGINYKSIFNADSAMLVAKYKGDSAYVKTHRMDLYAPNFSSDNKLTWDISQLKNVTIVPDSLLSVIGKKGHINEHCQEDFHRLFGKGYVMIAYPQYNALTNRLMISEWIEDASTCGTGRDNKYVFKKVQGGWQEIR